MSRGFISTPFLSFGLRWPEVRRSEETSLFWAVFHRHFEAIPTPLTIDAGQTGHTKEFPRARSLTSLPTRSMLNT
jgi:hypothetical protein